jgi:beta-1,4-mannosyl-glycoprotein beta-1,4-N-acetylglucosaminyltransferase
MHEVFPGLVGMPAGAKDSDVLVVSDLDELLRPGTLILLRHCVLPASLTLRSDFHYCSFQWKHHGA